MSVGDARRNALALALLLAVIAPLTTAAPLSDSTEIESYDEEAGCYYNFQHYGEGDRIMTNEPCLNCTCHNRMLMCYLRVCPFTKPIGQDCTVEKRGDQCCPIITCPDVPVDLVDSTTVGTVASTEVGHHDNYGCSIDGRFYTDGAQVPSKPNKPCELCYCIRNMTACVMQECTLHVEGCTPVYQRGVCCPVRYSCDHLEDDGPLMIDDMTTTIRPTPGFILTTTLTPGYTMECTHHDEVFADGAMIATDKACEHCYCMKGDIVCAVQECGTPMENEGKNCTAIAPKEGQCCPDNFVCEGEEAPTTVLSESDKDDTTDDIKNIEQELDTKPVVDASHADSDSDKYATTEGIKHKPEKEASKPELEATTVLESDKATTTESLKQAAELETDSEATTADSDIDKLSTTESFIHEQEIIATKSEQVVTTNLHADKDSTTQGIKHEPEVDTAKPDFDVTTVILESDKDTTTERLKYIPEIERESGTTIADSETNKVSTTEGFKHVPELETSKSELDATTEHSDKYEATEKITHKPEVEPTKVEIDATTIISDTNKDATTDSFKNEQEIDTSKPEQDITTVHTYADKKPTTQGVKLDPELETSEPDFDASTTLSETDKDATTEGFKHQDELDISKPEQVATTVHSHADHDATTQGIKDKPELETSKPDLEATTILADTVKDATKEGIKHEHELKTIKPEQNITTLHPYADQDATTTIYGIKYEPELESSKPDATTVLSESGKDETTEGFKHEHEIMETKPEQGITTLHPYADQDDTTHGIKHEPEFEKSEPEYDSTIKISESDKDITTEGYENVPEAETSKPISDETTVDSEIDKSATTEGFKHVPEIETSTSDSDATIVDSEIDKAITTEGFKRVPEVETSQSESVTTTEHSDVNKGEATESIKHEIEIEVTKSDLDATTVVPESVKYATTQGIKDISEIQEGMPFGGVTTVIPDDENDSTIYGTKTDQGLEILKPDEATIRSTEEEKTTVSSNVYQDISKTTVGLRDNKGENEEPEEHVSENEISEHADKVTESSIGEIDSTDKQKDQDSTQNDVLFVPSTESYESEGHISYDQKTDNAVPEEVDEFTGKPTTVLGNVEPDSSTDGHLTAPSIIKDKTDAESYTTPKQTEKEDEHIDSQQEIFGQEQEKTPSVKKDDHTISGLNEIETTTTSLTSHGFSHTEASEIGGSTLSDNLNTPYTNEEDTDKTSPSLPVSEIIKDNTDILEKQVTPEVDEHVTKIPVEESSGDGIFIDEFGSGESTTAESLDSKVHISDKDVESETKKTTSEIINEQNAPEKTTQSVEKVTLIPKIIDEHSAENDSSEQDSSQEISTDHLIDDEITTIHKDNEADITVHPEIDNKIHEATTASIISDVEKQTNIPVEISSESGQEFTTTHSVSKIKTDKPTSHESAEKEVESSEGEHATTPLTDIGHTDAEDITGKYDSLDKTTESHKLDQETRLPEISESDLENKAKQPEVEKISTGTPQDQENITELSQTAPEKSHLSTEVDYEHTTLDSTDISDSESKKTEDRDIQQKTTLSPERESDIKDLYVTTPSVKDVTDSQTIQPESTQKPLHSADEETSATTKLSAEHELDHTEKIDTGNKINAEHDITTLSSNEYDSYSEIPHVTHPEDIDVDKDDEKEVTLLPHGDHTYSSDEKTTLSVEVTTIASGEKSEVTTLRLTSVTEDKSHVEEEHRISEDGIKHATTTESSQVTNTDDTNTKIPEEITTETPTTVIDTQENEINEDHHKQPIDEPRIPGEGDCLVDGKSYRNKALIPTTNRCQTTCQCVNSIIKCEHVVCSPPPSNMVNCQPVYHGKDTCCPMYTCEHESVTIESDNQMSEHSTPSVDQSIKHITESPIEEDKIHEDGVTEQVAVSYNPNKDFTSGIEKGTTQLPVEEKPIIPSIYVPDCGTAGCKITKTPTEISTEIYDKTTNVHVTSGEYTTLHSITDSKQQEIDLQTLRPVSTDFEIKIPSGQDKTTLASEPEKEIEYQKTEKSTEEYDNQKTTVVIPSHISDNQDELTEDAVEESTDDNINVEIATATPQYVSLTTVAIEKDSSTETHNKADHEKDNSKQTQADIEVTTTTSVKETEIPDIYQVGQDENSEDKEQTTELDTYNKTEQSLDIATEKPDASVDGSHKFDNSELSSTPNIVKSETLSPSIDENKIVEDDHTGKTIIDEENVTTYASDHTNKIFDQVETTSKPSDVEIIDNDDKNSQEFTTKVSTEQVTSGPINDYTTVSSDDVNRIGVSVLPTDSVDEISPKKPDSSVLGACGHAGCEVEVQYTSLPVDITTVVPVSGDCQSSDCLDQTKSSEKPKESDCGENGCEDDEQNTIGDDLDKPVCGPNGCDYGTKHDKIDSTTEIHLEETQTSLPSSSKPSEESSTEPKVDCENGLCIPKEEIPDHHPVSEEHKETAVIPDQCSGKGCADKPIDIPVKTDDGEDIIHTTLHGDTDSQTVEPEQSTSYPDCSSPPCLEIPSGSTESPAITQKCSEESCEEAKLPVGEDKCTGDNCGETQLPIGEEKCSGDNCEQAKLPVGEDKCTGDNCGETELPIGEEKCSGDNCEEAKLPVGEDKCTGDNCEDAKLPVGEDKCTRDNCGETQLPIGEEKCSGHNCEEAKLPVGEDKCTGDNCGETELPIGEEKCSGDNCEEAKLPVGEDKCTGDNCGETKLPIGEEKCSGDNCEETTLPVGEDKCTGDDCGETKLPIGEEKCSGDNCGETKLPIGEEKCSGDNCEEAKLPVGEDKCSGASCDKTELPIGGEKCPGESCSAKSELESGTKPSEEDSQIDDQQKLDDHGITSKPDLSSEKEHQGTEVPTWETTEYVDLSDDKITLRPIVVEKSTDKSVDKSTTESSTEMLQTTRYALQHTLSPQSHTVKTDSTTVKAVNIDENESSTTMITEIPEEHITHANEIESTKKPLDADISSEDDQHLEEPDHTKSQTSKTTIESDTETYTVPSVTQSEDDDLAVTDSEHVTDSHKHGDHHEVDEKDNQITKGDVPPQVSVQSSESATTGKPDVHVTTAFEDQNTTGYPESVDATTSIDKTEEKEQTEHSLGKEQITVRPVTDKIMVKDVEPLINAEVDKATKPIEIVTEAGIEHFTLFDENKEDKLDIDANDEKPIATTVATQEDEKTTDKPLVDKTEKPIAGDEISHTAVEIGTNEDKYISDKISTDKSEEDDSVRNTATESEIIESTTHALESITPASETSHEEDVTARLDLTKVGGIVETELKDTHVTIETDVTQSSDIPKPTIYIEDSDVVHTTVVYTDDDNIIPIDQEIENETKHTTLSSHDDDVNKPVISVEDMKHAETTSVDESKKATEPTIVTDDLGQTTLSSIAEDKQKTKLESSIEITPTTVLPIDDRDKTTVPSKYVEDQEAAEPNKEEENAHTTFHPEHDAEKVTESVTLTEIGDQTDKSEKDKVTDSTESAGKEKISQITKLHESGTEKYTTVSVAEHAETVTHKADNEKQSEEDTQITPSTVSADISQSTEVPANDNETEKGEHKPEQYLTTHIPVDEQATEHEKNPHEADFNKGQDIDQTIDFGEEEINHTTTIVDNFKEKGPSEEGIYPTVIGEGEQSEMYTTPIGENVDLRKPTEEEIRTTISGEHVTTVKIPVDQPGEAHTVSILEKDETEKPTGKPDEDIAHTTTSVNSDEEEKTTETLEKEVDQITEKNKVKTPAEQLEEDIVHTTASSGGDEANRPTDKPEYEKDYTTVSSESDENKKPTEQADKGVVQTTISPESDETKRPTQHSEEDKHTTISSDRDETKKPEEQTDIDVVQTTVSSESDETKKPEEQTNKDVVQIPVSSEIDESKRPTDHSDEEKHTTVSSDGDEVRRPTDKPEEDGYHTTVSVDQHDVKKPTEQSGDEGHTIVTSEGDTTKGSTEKSEVDISTTVSSDKYDQEKTTVHPKDSEKTTVALDVALDTDEANRPTDKPNLDVDHTTNSDEVKKSTEQTDKDIVQTTVSSEIEQTKRPIEYSEDDKYTTVSSESADENKSTKKPGVDDAHITISAEKYDVKKPTENVEEEGHTTVGSEIDESNKTTEHPEDSGHTIISVESDDAKKPTDTLEDGVDNTTIFSERDEVKKPTEHTDKDVVQTIISSEKEETKRPTEQSEDDKYTTVHSESDDENKSTEKPGIDDAHTKFSADKYDVNKPTEHVEEEGLTTVRTEIDESNKTTEHPKDSVHTTIDVESDEEKKPTAKPASDLDHTTIKSEIDEAKKPTEPTDKEVVEATTSAERDETKKPSEDSVENDEEDEHMLQISEKHPDIEATTASDESTPPYKSSEYPFTSTVTVHDYITSKMPTAADVTTEVPYQSSSKYPDTAVDPGLDQAEISSIPNPDEDEDHQVPQLPSFPPSYGTSGNEEPDYEGEDQAFGPGTCRYGGKVYVSAQQIPRDDPCDFCFCFRSDIICLQQSCPPPIQHCHEEPIQGFCCPRYECPVSMATVMNVTTTTTTTTTTLPPHFLSHAYKGAAQRRGCQIKGQSYQVGETIKQTSGPCLHCICGSDGQMKCDPKVCTPEPMLRQMIAVAATSRRR